MFMDSLPADEREAHEKLVRLALTARKLHAKQSN